MSDLPISVITQAALDAGNVSTEQPAPEQEAPQFEPEQKPPGRGHQLGAPRPPAGASSSAPVESTPGRGHQLGAPRPPAGASSSAPAASTPGRGHQLGAPRPPAGASQGAKAPPGARSVGGRQLGHAVPVSQQRTPTPAPNEAQAVATPGSKLRQAHKLLVDVLPDLAGTKAHKSVHALLETLSNAIAVIEDAPKTA